MTPEIQGLLSIIRDVGMWAVFAWLYISEKKDHAITRREKDAEIEKQRSAHLPVPGNLFIRSISRQSPGL